MPFNHPLPADKTKPWGDLVRAAWAAMTTFVNGLETALAGKASASHSHPISQITSLQSALDSKASTSHSHTTSDVTGLDTALAGKAASSHTHTTSQVTGLDTALAGKAASSHSHPISQVTGLQTALDSKLTSSDGSVKNLRLLPPGGTVVGLSGSVGDIVFAPVE